MDGKILLHVCFAALCVQIWFGIVPNLAVSMLFSIPFIDRLISVIFPSKQKVVSWHSNPVAIPVSSVQFKSSTPTTAVVYEQTCNTYKTDIEVAGAPAPVCMAPQALLKHYSEYRVRVTQSASGILTIEPRKKKVLFPQAMSLSKHMVVA